MMTTLDRTQSVARMVAEHPALAAEFQQYQIDFCCHGDVSLDEACRERELDAETVFGHLRVALLRRGRQSERSVEALSTPRLLEYIETKHHAYLSETLPSLAFLAAKVADVHGDRNPKLRQLCAAVEDLAGAIAPHLEHEEEVLFPALRSTEPDSTLIEGELRAMFEEHLEVGQVLALIRSLSDGFTTPDWGCGAYAALMRELQALETDTLRHVHVENHVLMPRFVRTASARSESEEGLS